jgi:hypothetical protein
MLTILNNFQIVDRPLGALISAHHDVSIKDCCPNLVLGPVLSIMPGRSIETCLQGCGHQRDTFPTDKARAIEPTEDFGCKPQTGVKSPSRN